MDFTFTVWTHILSLVIMNRFTLRRAPLFFRKCNISVTGITRRWMDLKTVTLFITVLLTQMANAKYELESCVKMRGKYNVL